MRFLLLLFIGMPILEMWLLIEVGSAIGALPTISLVLLTAMIGLALLRQQGLSTLLKANQRMESGQLPAEELIEGFMLAVGGALLLTPGFLTDSIGFACLLPWSRRYLAKACLKNAQFSAFTMGSSSMGSNPFGSSSGETIDGEYSREDDPRLR